MLDKWFYIIYNAYYKHGNYRNGHPIYTAVTLFAALFGLVWLSFEEVINIFFFENYISLYKEDLPAILTSCVFMGLSYFLFMRKNRYEIIYNKYSNDKFLNSIQGKILGFLLLLLGCFSSILIAFLRNYYLHGRFV
jgi:hypothetical protein